MYDEQRFNINCVKSPEVEPKICTKPRDKKNKEGGGGENQGRYSTSRASDNKKSSQVTNEWNRGCQLVTQLLTLKMKDSSWEGGT